MPIKKLREDYMLLISLVLLLAVSLINPSLISSYPQFVHWGTILILATLFLITTALKTSGFLDSFALRLLLKLSNGRNMALLLILLSFFLSMFITNDVTLLVLVPLTISLGKFMREDIKKVIIFETLAVNAGSALTPVGNPQNIYLWHLWNVSFFAFVIHLLPLCALMLILLILFAFLVFPSKNIEKIEYPVQQKEERFLSYLSLILLLIFIVLMQFNLQLYMVPVVFLAYLYRPKIYREVDWPLLLIFILFFIDFNAIGRLQPVQSYLSSRSLGPVDVYAYSALFSQGISNVPAAILFSNYTTAYPFLVYGVSVGGNGTLIASLANIIALRFINDRRFILEFHKYSLPYFLVSFILFLLLLHFL